MNISKTKFDKVIPFHADVHIQEGINSARKSRIKILSLSLVVNSNILFNIYNCSTAGVLTPEILNGLRQKFFADRRNIQAQNSCVKNDPLEICVSRKNVESTSHAFQHRVSEVKPMTNQKNSGRCWIFATLNVIRIPFMKQYNLEEFEFSQAYLFFWDKVRK